MSLLQLINDLSEIMNEDTQNEPEVKVKTYDLSNDEDYDEFADVVKSLKDNKLFDSLCSLFNINANDLCESVLDTTNKYREDNKKVEEKKVEDKQPKEFKQNIFQTDIKEKKLERPSQNISVNTGLQIHKLVQEYIDTMVKPYNPKEGGLTQKQINDAYAGLYEFACWIINHK